MGTAPVVTQVRLELGETQRAGHVLEGVADELGMHAAHKLLLRVDEGCIRARHEVDLELPLAQLGLEAGIVEVLVEGVELVQCVSLEAARVALAVHAPQQVSVVRSVGNSAVGLCVAMRFTNRMVALRRAPSAAQVVGLARDEPLRFENLEVVAHGVLVQARAGGEFAQQQPWLALDLAEQPQTAGLSKPAVVLGAARHTPIMTGRGRGWNRPSSRIVAGVNYLAAVVTVSDRSAARERADAAGPVAVAALRTAGFACGDARIVADGAASVETTLRALLAEGAQLIVTTGGTGVAPRDATPEGTAPLLTHLLPGIPEELRRLGAAEAPGGLLSRGLAGIVAAGELSAQGALVVNLPGSPRAVASGMPVVLAVAAHVLDQVQGGDHA